MVAMFPLYPKNTIKRYDLCLLWFIRGEKAVDDLIGLNTISAKYKLDYGLSSHFHYTRGVKIIIFIYKSNWMSVCLYWKVSVIAGPLSLCYCITILGEDISTLTAYNYPQNSVIRKKVGAGGKCQLNPPPNFWTPIS